MSTHHHPLSDAELDLIEAFLSLDEDDPVRPPELTMDGDGTPSRSSFEDKELTCAGPNGANPGRDGSRGTKHDD